MRKRSIAFVAVLALGTLGGSVLALAQTANPTAARKTFGFQDSKTGTFHPLGKSADLSNTTATTTYSGTIEATITITLKTALPKGDAIVCSVDAIASSENETTFAGVTYDDSAASTATVSGSTATCKVNIPFSWVMFTASTTVVNSLDGSLSVVMYSPTATTITQLVEDFARDHSQSITINAGKPADGTLTVTEAVTL
ncbi:exported hypothetical protein [Candidatus Sulfotelmatobacter kueseliae]|uniref:Uncharacterized protein n=1 Tax=Candidatus Sulfotelmatobacter kueseliae TaxID=2042962 RepID=A0A2U3KYH7_9BACT|nr:exported hypothetical protein [Candidatus Sulfotelmatobacter kueseliae]